MLIVLRSSLLQTLTPLRHLRSQASALAPSVPATTGSTYFGMPEKLRARRKPMNVLRRVGSYAERDADRQNAAA